MRAPVTLHHVTMENYLLQSQNTARVTQRFMELLTASGVTLDGETILCASREVPDILKAWHQAQQEMSGQ